MTKKILFALVGLTLLASEVVLWADSLYPAEGTNSLYTEKRARRVGDVITVLIEETNQAVNSASSQDQRASGLAVGAGTGFLGAGIYGNSVLSNVPNQIGVGASTAHQGQGSSSRASTITGQMTAKIVSILPSGNYMIQGSRYVEVNDEKQTIEVTGEIRPDDISSDNIVLSSRIGEARIKFTGVGPASETATPGLLTRVLGWLGLF